MYADDCSTIGSLLSPFPVRHAPQPLLCWEPSTSSNEALRVNVKPTHHHADPCVFGPFAKLGETFEYPPPQIARQRASLTFWTELGVLWMVLFLPQKSRAERCPEQSYSPFLLIFGKYIEPNQIISIDISLASQRIYILGNSRKRTHCS